MPLPLIVGAHHKTGSSLATRIVSLLADCVPPTSFGMKNEPAYLQCAFRKLPLSLALKTVPRRIITSSQWFEHRIDVTEIKFLHFVRDPLACIASAYLYHMRGAPNDNIKWTEWAIFQFAGQKSYREVLNALSLADGVFLEAIRTYPEAMGTARAFASATARLQPDNRLAIWLDAFEARPLKHLNDILRFVCGPAHPDREAFLQRAQAEDIILHTGSRAIKSGHVTRNDPARGAVDRAITSSTSIRRLYDVVIRRMGLHKPPMDVDANHQAEDIIDDIARNTPLLMTSPLLVEQNPGFWTDRAAAQAWQCLALSTVGNGHLMMYPFMQRYISRLVPRANAETPLAHEARDVQSEDAAEG